MRLTFILFAVFNVAQHVLLKRDWHRASEESGVQTNMQGDDFKFATIARLYQNVLIKSIVPVATHSPACARNT